MDYGKVAATFLNSSTGEAVRIVALDGSREMADKLYPEVSDKKERQMRAYAEAEDGQLFKVERVSVRISDCDRPGRALPRVFCGKCCEGVNDARESLGEAGGVLCRPCSEGGYYELIQ
jgi:formylmethanofuran dehydrogenase subunit E